MRRAAQLCDAWHPLGLGWADLERGIATVRELAERAGRGGAVGVAPRNLLSLTDAARGQGRGPFEGSATEVAADVRRAVTLGCDWVTFDMPQVDVPGMVTLMERFAREVRPAAG